LAALGLPGPRVAAGVQGKRSAPIGRKGKPCASSSGLSRGMKARCCCGVQGWDIVNHQGRPLYVDHINKRTQWHPPAMPKPSSAKGTPACLPAGCVPACLREPACSFPLGTAAGIFLELC
jgi:hypothetical protein